MVDIRVVEARALGRWWIAFRDSDRWQIGVYCPENCSREDVRMLERHDAPELFVLLRGSIVLVVEEGGVVREVPMEPGKLYVVEEWHNAYRPGGCEGVALVVERPGVRTEFKEVRLGGGSR